MQSQARDIAFLPASLGGLGLMHAERLSPAAYWAAWADALPVLQQPCPRRRERCLQELQAGSQAAAPSLQAAAAAGDPGCPGVRSGQKAELCHSSGWPTPRHQGSQQTIDDGSISSSMVLPHAARPCAAMQHLCHLSDAMAAPKRERLSGMGSQLRRHSAASWHVTPNSLAVALIACVFLPLRSGGAGTTNPSTWCSASLHCVRAVPLPRCAPQPRRVGQGAGGVALAVAVQRATCSAVLGVWTMPPLPTAENDVPLAEVLQFAADTAPSRLPLR